MVRDRVSALCSISGADESAGPAPGGPARAEMLEHVAHEASAAMMAKLPVEDILAHKKLTGSHHPLRDKGKRAELACGLDQTNRELCGPAPPSSRRAQNYRPAKLLHRVI